MDTQERIAKLEERGYTVTPMIGIEGYAVSGFGMSISFETSDEEAWASLLDLKTHNNRAKGSPVASEVQVFEHADGEEVPA